MRKTMIRVATLAALFALIITAATLPCSAASVITIITPDENGYYPSFNELAATYGKDALLCIAFDFNESADSLGVNYDVCAETRCFANSMEWLGTYEPFDWYACSLDMAGGYDSVLFEESWYLTLWYGADGYTVSIMHTAEGNSNPIIAFLKEAPQGLKNSFNGVIYDAAHNIKAEAQSGFEWLACALAIGIFATMLAQIFERRKHK